MENQKIKVPVELARQYGFENGLEMEEKDFRIALQMVVDDANNVVNDHRKDGKSIKSNPLCNLIDGGQFTVDRILEELPKLEAKTSELPSGQREVMMQAIEMAMVMMLRAMSEELEKKMKGQDTKTE